MCDRVGFIREGRLILEQKISDFARQAIQTYDISFVNPAPVAELRRISGAKLAVNTPRHVTVTLRGELAPLFAVLVKYKVNSLDRREINLEEEFLQFYRRGKRR